MRDMARQACAEIRAADRGTVERWLRDRTELPDSVPIVEVLVGEEAERAILADLVPAVQRFRALLAEDNAPEDWQERATEVLSEETLVALKAAGALTDLSRLAEDGLVGVVRTDEDDWRPFRTIDVAAGLDTGAMLDAREET